MIVVFIDSQEDTAIFHNVYEGIENVKLMINPMRSDVEKVLAENPQETVFLFGHGDENGLPSFPDESSHLFVIDEHNSHLLKDRKVIGVWCYAKEFGKKCGLEGFFTSMFISNREECRMFGFKHSDEETFEQNTLFAQRINKLLKTGIDMKMWPLCLQNQADMSVDFINFNYSALEYLDGK